MAGVIPVIFAAAILAFPQTVGQFCPQTQQLHQRALLAVESGRYLLVEVVLILVFTFFYTAVQFNPVDQADNLRKYGGYIPGIRPGPPTAHYLDRVLTRLTLPGSLFLGDDRGPAVDLHPLRRLLAGDLARARRHLGADRRRRRPRHDAPDGVADDDALLRGIPALDEPLGSRPTGRRARGRRRSGSRRSTRFHTSPPATCSAPRSQPAPSSASRSSRSSRAASSCPDDVTVALIRERPRRARRGRRLRARRLPAEPGAGGGARRDARRDRPLTRRDPLLRPPRRRSRSSGCSSAPPRRTGPTTRPR